MRFKFKLMTVVAIVLLSLTGCSNNSTESEGKKVDANKGSEYVSNEEVDKLLKETFPEQMEDGKIKVAVIRNLAAGDHTQQFLDGAVSEGKSLGFVVDTFVTDGDNVKTQDTISQIAQQDYDGLILSHGEAGYTYNSLKPLIEKGMKVVTFDSVPYEDGDPSKPILEGVTSTAQEDTKLAELSLGSMVDNLGSTKKPLKVIRAWMGPGVPPLDKRQTIYDKFVADGLIEEVALVGPVDGANARGGTQDALAAILPRYSEGEVDAIWGSYDELAKGCLQALNDAGRKDVKIFSIDISNDDINLMLENDDVWLSTAAVDPKLIGISNMRLLAAKFAGEETPDEYNLPAQLVKTSQLNTDINMTNIATVVDGWGEEKGIFDDYEWMAAIKEEVAK